MLLRGLSFTEKSSTSWGQDREWKLFLKILTHGTKRRQEVPSSLKFSNSSPSSSSTCLHEDWQPGSGTYYPWKHRLLTTQLTVGSAKLVQMKFCVLKKNPNPNHQNSTRQDCISQCKAVHWLSQHPILPQQPIFPLRSLMQGHCFQCFSSFSLLLAKGLLCDTSLSLVITVWMSSVSKDKLKGQRTPHFWKDGKQSLSFLCYRFFPFKREVQNTHHKTSNRATFACLWGCMSFLNTEASNRANSEIQESTRVLLAVAFWF